MGKDLVPVGIVLPGLPLVYRVLEIERIHDKPFENEVEVFIASPYKPEGTYAVSFTVQFSKAPKTPEAAIATFLEHYRQGPDFREIGRVSGMVAGNPAIEAEIAYTMPLPLNSLNPQWKVIQERHIFFRSDSLLIELIYAAPDEMYDTWLPDFRTLVQTLTLPVEPDNTVFYPLISISEAASIRERAPDDSVRLPGNRL